MNTGYDPQNVKPVLVILQCDRCWLSFEYIGRGRVRWQCPQCYYRLKITRKEA